MWGFASIEKRTVIHDTECPFLDQVSLKNTKLKLVPIFRLLFDLPFKIYTKLHRKMYSWRGYFFDSVIFGLEECSAGLFVDFVRIVKTCLYLSQQRVENILMK